MMIMMKLGGPLSFAGHLHVPGTRLWPSLALAHLIRAQEQNCLFAAN